MIRLEEISIAIGKECKLEKSISGYWRLLVDGELYEDEPANEDLNGSYEEAEAYYVNTLLEYEVPEDKKELRCGVWFLTCPMHNCVDFSRGDDESRECFLKRIADRLYSYIGTEHECKSVRHQSGSAVEKYYRTGESVKSESIYVYEIDKEGNVTTVQPVQYRVNNRYIVHALSLFLRDETLEECPIRIVSRKDIEGENAELVHFTFGEDEESCVAVVYDDGSVYTPQDWQTPIWNEEGWSIEATQWMDSDHTPAINFHGMPRIFK